MRDIFSNTWPLFFGLSMIMIANGLQGTLLGLRAGLEGFPLSVIGLVMSCYYVGFLAGSILTPHLVEKVGHVRVFAALASLASVTVLGHLVFDRPEIWAALRIFTGFGYAGLFVVIESWLNTSSSEKNRGGLLATYMTVTYLGLILGQYLITVADPAEIELFVITSALVSLALVPLSLVHIKVPDFSAPEIISLRRLFKLSPQGIYGVFASGMQGGAVLGIGAVYANSVGLSTAQIANFMACFILGGVVMQYPLGALSDRIGRRNILSAVAVLSAILAFAASMFEGVLVENVLYMKLAVFFIGGFSFPIYALSLAHVNDKISSSAMTRASGKLVLVNGAGAIVGPAAATFLMGVMGSSGFFLTIAAVHLAFGFLSIYRSVVSDAIAVEDQNDFTMMPARSSTLVGELVEHEEA